MLTQKEKRQDGFLNLDHRTRNIAAFLRCLIAAIEYSVDFNTKRQAVECIHDPDMFRAITQLCDATDWDELASIGGKYLRIMRHVIQIPIDKDIEKHDMLFHYDLLAIVINRVLGKIMDKIKKDIQMTNADKFTNYELSYTLFMVVQNTCQFQFSTLDIVRLYRQNEIKIEWFDKFIEEPEKQTAPQDELDKCGSSLSDFEYDKSITISKKCTLTSRTKNEVANKFKPDLTVMLQKRQIQQQIIELMIIKMFTKQTIFSLVDILFKDMSGDKQIFEESRAKAIADENDEEPEVKKEEGKPQDEENFQEQNENDKVNKEEMQRVVKERSKMVCKFEVNEKDYLDIKSALTIERIKDIVGEILCHCPEKMVYTILEYIMKGVIFEKKYLRQSFMQEVLNVNKSAFFKIEFQKYINANYIRIVDGIQLMQHVEPQPRLLKIQERIIEMTNCDLNLTPIIDKELVESAEKDIQEQEITESVIKVQVLKEFVDQNFQQRILCLCNNGIQIFKRIDPNDICDKCDPTQFCPRGPIPDLIILYEDIQHIVIVPQIPQKLVIIFKIPHFVKEAVDGDKSNMVDKCLFYIQAQLTINIPNYTKSAKIFSYLRNNLSTVRSMIKNEEMAAKNFEEFKGHSYKLKNIKEEIKMPKQEETQLVVYDQIVQIQLQFCIYQIQENIEASVLNEKLLNYCSLLDTNMLSKKYIETKVANIPLQSAKKPLLQHPMFTQFSKYRHIETQMNENSVFIVIIKPNLIILKEFWCNWEFIFDPSKVVSYKKKNKDDVINQTALQVQKVLREENEPNKDKDSVGHREWELKKYFGDLFKIILVWDLNQCKNLNVHKGKDATVELIGDSKDVKVPPPKLSLKFLGDMERQGFIDNVNEALNDEEGDEEEEEEQEGQQQQQQQEVDDDEDSDDNKDVEIVLDEPIDPIIFD